MTAMMIVISLINVLCPVHPLPPTLVLIPIPSESATGARPHTSTQRTLSSRYASHARPRSAGGNEFDF